MSTELVDIIINVLWWRVPTGIYQDSEIRTFRKSESIGVHNENNDNNDYLHNLKTTHDMKLGARDRYADSCGHR